MSCHFSCSTCSSPTYMFKCLTCPPTRTLIDSTCVCSTGYYQAQTSSCYDASQASILDQMLLPIADGFYFANIAIFWVYIIIIFCRVNSPKIRITINFAQIMALLLYYPFLLDQTSKQFINTLSVFNFSYIFNLYTCSNSTICTLFEYLWQPMLILPGVLACFFISYCLTNLCYKYALSQPITFKNYWVHNWAFVLFCFIDQTAVIMGYNLTKAAMLTSWGYIFLGVYLLVVFVMIRKFFKTINTEDQSKIIYRAQNSWAYGYDENYHLHFIDFLYTEARHKQQPEPSVDPITLQQKPQPPTKSNKTKYIPMFIPHSNLYIMELLFKILTGATTVLLYEYKPTFIIYSFVILLNIFMCWMGAFFYYEKSTIVLYLLLSIAVLVCASCYWMSFFWLVAVGVSILVTGIIGAVLIVLFFVNRKINDKLINKMFDDDDTEKVANQLEQLSQEEMNIKNNQQEEVKPEQDQLASQPTLSTKKQPFVGNLTRKTKPKPNQTISPGDIFKLQNKNKSMKETIIQEPPNQEIIQNPPIESQQILIKHSNYQTKLSSAKAKLSARNKTKNVFDNVEENSEKSVSKEEKKIKTQTSKNQTKFLHLNQNGDDEFLSNVLEEPAEEQAQQKK